MHVVGPTHVPIGGGVGGAGAGGVGEEHLQTLTLLGKPKENWPPMSAGLTFTAEQVCPPVGKAWSYYDA